jgi:hypothetical protein
MGSCVAMQLLAPVTEARLLVDVEHVSALSSPFLLAHRLVADDVLAQHMLELLRVAPMLRIAVLHPENAGSRQNEPEQFDQIWFAGNHADVGGSYPENESRLSDITLKWMVNFITLEIPDAGRVVVNADLLKLYPSSSGMMHDECMVGMGGTVLKWGRAVRDVPNTAKLHETVYERLALPRVRNFTSYGPYRPVALKSHDEAKKFYEANEMGK